MSEEELAIVDLLTKPDPELSDDELAMVKASAKTLLEHLHDKLVIDWRRKADASNDVLVTIRRSLDDGLPDDPYPREVFDAKVQRIYDQVLAAYQDDGTSTYTTDVAPAGSLAPSIELSPSFNSDELSEAVIDRIRTDPGFAARIAAELGLQVRDLPLNPYREQLRTPINRTGLASSGFTTSSGAGYTQNPLVTL